MSDSNIVLSLVNGVAACGKCGYFSCVCKVVEKHKPECKFLRAASLQVEILCEHGFQACPTCDPCDCGIGNINGIT